MNRERRARLRQAVELFNQGTEILEDVLADEETAMDSIPENLHGSEKYATLEENVEALSQAVDDANDLMENISDL